MVDAVDEKKIKIRTMAQDLAEAEKAPEVKKPEPVVPRVGEPPRAFRPEMPPRAETRPGVPPVSLPPRAQPPPQLPIPSELPIKPEVPRPLVPPPPVAPPAGGLPPAIKVPEIAKKPFYKRFYFIALIILLLLAGTVVFLGRERQKKVIRIRPSPTPTRVVVLKPTPSPSPSPFFPSLIAVDDQQVLPVELTRDSVLVVLSNILRSERKDGSFRQIILKDKEGNILKADDLARVLGLSLPAGFWRNVSDPSKITLFSYGQKEDFGSLTGFRSRFGFVLKVDNVQSLRPILKDLEKEWNRYLTILGFRPKIGIPRFSETVIQERVVRFINFPVADLAFDYAFDLKNSYLLFTTSRESMIALIRKVVLGI